MEIISMENYSMNTQIVRNRMTPRPIIITPQTTFPAARQLMAEYHIRYLPVVNKGKLVGIVTRRDINRVQSEDCTSLSSYELNLRLERLTASEFMSSPVVTISPDAPLGEAAQLMLKRQIGGLPVLEDGKLVGIITETGISLSILQRDFPI
jgi:acetoin utilization protein AcuB